MSVVTATPAATVHAARVSECEAIARALKASLVEHDVDQVEIAAEIGRSPSIVQRICDPSRPDVNLTLMDVRTLCSSRCARIRAVGVDVAAHLIAPAHHQAVPVHAHDTIADDFDHLRELIASGAEIAAHEIGACADDKITAAEAVIGIKLHREALQLHEASIARYQAALKSSESPVRRSDAATPS